MHSSPSSYTPPALRAGWIDDNRVGVIYDSERQLCHLAKGLIEGIGEYYDEPLNVEEVQCMHDGGDECRLVVSRV
ncbi:MAG: V4R domain-containing protein, partial [Halobacteriota archaeon]